MHGTSHPAVAEVIFGLDPLWFAGTLFVLTYVLIVTERLNRAIISLTAACLMILGGVLTQEAPAYLHDACATLLGHSGDAGGCDGGALRPAR